MTYTSLLTQCAKLGQADRAAVVLDKLNRKRGSSGNSGITSGIGRTLSESSTGVSKSWRMNPELENDLLKLFGKADQVDAAFKVRSSNRGANDDGVRDGEDVSLRGGGGV